MRTAPEEIKALVVALMRATSIVTTSGTGSDAGDLKALQVAGDIIEDLPELYHRAMVALQARAERDPN